MTRMLEHRIRFTPSKKPKKMKNARARITGKCLTETICKAIRVVVLNITVATENLGIFS